MALIACTHLTLAFVFAEVLVVSDELIFIIDAEQGISSRQFLVKLPLGGHQVDLATLLAVRACMPSS